MLLVIKKRNILILIRTKTFAKSTPIDCLNLAWDRETCVATMYVAGRIANFVFLRVNLFSIYLVFPG